MKEWPSSFWAAIFILLACSLLVTALFSKSSNSSAVITAATSIITGAFGYIQGKRESSSALENPTVPVEPAKTK